MAERTIGPRDIPVERVKEIMDKSEQTGNEHAFAFCAPTDTQEGSKRKVNVEQPVCRQVGVVHTHPGGQKRLSPADKKVLKSDKVDMVCVGIPGEDGILCEIDQDGKTARETLELNQAIDEALIDGECEWFQSDSGKIVLGILPKGSKCIDTKNVPSRSDYHDSDQVERCRIFDVPGRDQEEKEEEDDHDPDDCLTDIPSGNVDTNIENGRIFVEMNTGNKQWVAKITDTHPKFNFERDFIAFQKPKTSARASGNEPLSDGDIIEYVRFTHSGKNRSDNYYEYSEDLEMLCPIEEEEVVGLFELEQPDWDSVESKFNA